MKRSPIPFVLPKIQLVYKTGTVFSERRSLKGSKEAALYFVKTWDHCKIEIFEQFKMVLLDSKSHAIGLYELSSELDWRTLVKPKEVFSAALRANASSIMIAHNNPHGDVFPSRADETFTSELAVAAKVLGIPLVDHIIVTMKKYFSFSQENLL